MLILTLNESLVYGLPAKATDTFVSGCKFAELETERLLWSSGSTWPSGRVPGINGDIGANATIPCGQAVVLDLPEVTLSVLHIKGLLTFLDDSSRPKIKLRSNFIIVEGQFVIGSESTQFSQKAIIELTPNLNKRRSYSFTDLPPADPANPRDFGHKAFVVVGGQVSFHGLPGGSATEAWCRLIQTAEVSETQITVDADVSASWPIGGTIAVASTDYDRNQAEVFTIAKLQRKGSGSAVITLDKPLQYMHYGKPNSLSDGFGGFVEQRAEVALLDRNIKVMGTEEGSPYDLEGGHFMVFMTNNPGQLIEGVQFYNMGQQGLIGRYPVHFHVLGSVPSTVFRKNAVVKSHQRCVVVHASHNITVEGNVAFNTSGHCFMTEEGAEMDNKFLRNLGMLTKPVTKKIMLPNSNPPTSDESDDKPSTFWMSNARNTLRGNVAAGSADSGFWYELRLGVRGLTRSIPSINSTIPFRSGISDFKDNVAHSNSFAGLRTYPPGIRPRVSGWDTDGPIGVINNFLSYKNSYQGMFVHHTDLLLITNSTFADNGWAIHLNQDFRVTVANSRFVAVTENLGNPKGCDNPSIWSKCKPAQPGDCRMPLPGGTRGRSVGGGNRLAPSFGVVIDHSRGSDGYLAVRPNSLKSLKFHNYDATCTNSTAIVLLGPLGSADFWNPGHSVEGLEFSSNTRPLWSTPEMAQVDQFNTVFDLGEVAQFYTLLDKDGSIMGQKGYLVANATTTLPPGRVGCSPKPQWNAYACQGVCYRTIMVAYPEPGFDRSSSNLYNRRGDFSYLKVIRVSDGATILLDGNLKKYKFPDPIQRYFYATVLANQVYQLEIVPSPKAPSFLPANLTVGLVDLGLCGKGLTLHLKQAPNKPWVGPSTSTADRKQCEGVVPHSDTVPTVQYSTVCLGNKPWMEVVFSPAFSSTVRFARSSSSDGGACPAGLSCSLVWRASAEWLYDDSGEERRPDFYNPILTSPQNWKNGGAPLGRNPWNSALFRSTVLQPSKDRLTYYYRYNFALKKCACYDSLNVDIVVNDGVALYLNNKEVLRSNLPQGSMSNKSLALSTSPDFTWKSFSVPLSSKTSYFLVDGVNTLAVEQHVANPWVPIISFDLRISAVQSSLECKRSANGSAEICDGIDNNLNGVLDERPDGKPLTQECSTVCGTGFSTCISGLYRKCTAKQPTEEICDGVDNDCDGLIDNGAGQLNCEGGFACSSGKCLPVFNATKSKPIWPRGASGWSYNDKGGNLDALNPQWRKGLNVASWPKGSAPLGCNYNSQKNLWDKYSTTLQFFGKDDKSLTVYFVKSFEFTQTQIDQTFSIDFTIRRVDGAVVYLNGGELWRSNMRWGPVRWNTTSEKVTVTKEFSPGCCDLEWTYKKCPLCYRNTTALLKAGTNTIAVEVHLGYRFKKTAAFDMDLNQNAIQPCSSFPGAPKSCLRSVQQFISPVNAVWKYLDGTLPIPSSSWKLPSFNDKSWKSGVAPLGYGANAQWIILTNIQSQDVYEAEARRAFYFRRTINVPDALCYFQLSSNLRSKDGAVLYINGLEVYRRNMPSGPINSTTFARWAGLWTYETQQLAGGWLKKGENLFAVELHRASSSSTIFFELNILGSREGITCLSKPL